MGTYCGRTRANTTESHSHIHYGFCVAAGTTQGHGADDDMPQQTEGGGDVQKVRECKCTICGQKVVFEL